MAETQPPEPPVGTILDTENNINRYRIERTDLGWHIQHNGGADEFGNRLTSFMGRGISWRAAWAAWGPPSGAAPFREVPAGTPPLPPDPEEPAPAWEGMGLDATNQKLDPPPPAQPWTPKGADVNETTKGAVEGASTVTPTGLATSVASGVTGKDIKSPVAAAAAGGTTSGGSGMASIEEVRAGIDAAKEKASESLGALQQAQSALEEAQAQMVQVTEGSGQSDTDEANAALARAVETVTEAQQNAQVAIEAAETVVARL